MDRAGLRPGKYLPEVQLDLFGIIRFIQLHQLHIRDDGEYE